MYPASKTPRDFSFWIFVVILLSLLAAASYAPVFSGKIPFPKDMVLQFPPWAGFPHPDEWRTYADIGDQVAYFYPFRAYTARAVREGTLPLWNPDFLAGAPFLADAQSSLFYPPNFLYYIASVKDAWTAALILKLLLSGIFMTLCVRSIGASRAGAVFSGITFSYCGFMTAWQGQVMSDAALWLPAVYYCVHRLNTSTTGGSIALAAVVFAMPVLAGHPETAAHLAMVGVALAVLFWAASIMRGNANNRAVLSFGLAGILAAGLAAIQILPTLEWLAEIPNALADRWPPLPFDQVRSLVSRDILRFPNAVDIWIPVSSAYIGMIGLLAASLAPLHTARKHVICLMVLTVCAFCAAYGIDPVHWLISQLPVIQGLKNERATLILNFGLAALGGLGLSALETAPVIKGRRRMVALFLLFAAFAAAFLLVYDLQRDAAFRVEFTRRPSFSRALLFVGIIPFVWKLYGGLRGRTFPVVVCAIAAFDLVSFSYGYTGYAKRNEIFPPSPAFDFLLNNNDPERYRVIQIGQVYPSNTLLVFGLSSVDGYEVRITGRQQDFLRELREPSLDSAYFLASRVLKANDRRLDMLNVKHLILSPHDPEFAAFSASNRFRQVFNDGYIAIFENDSVLPRAFAAPAGGVEILARPDQQLERIRSSSFDPEANVIVSELPRSFIRERASESSGFSGNVEVTASDANTVRLKSVTSAASVVALSQMYYPGWNATVDGAPAEVFPVDIALTGIAVPAGAHEIEFRFQPASFRAGAAASAIAALAIAGLLISGIRRQRLQNE